jgi:hypothetical protein
MPRSRGGSSKSRLWDFFWSKIPYFDFFTFDNREKVFYITDMSRLLGIERAKRNQDILRATQNNLDLGVRIIKMGHQVEGLSDGLMDVKIPLGRNSKERKEERVFGPKRYGGLVITPSGLVEIVK